MIIGIENTPLISPHKARGVGFYTKRLIEALENLARKNKDFSIKTDSYKSLASEADLIHFPFFSPLFLTLPLFKKKPTVVTVHDLIPLKFPKHFPKGVRGSLKWQIQKFSLKSAKAIITDSLSSKKDIVKLAGIKKEKIFVIYLAADEVFKPIQNKRYLEKLKKRYNLPQKFVLYVGDFNFNKNVNLLTESCLQLNYPLIIVGRQALQPAKEKSHIENQSLLKFQESAKENPEKIIRLGFVPTDDLVGIYNLATIYVQPSIAEGFGLPVLEAMACGCPVITSQKTSLGEIAGQKALSIDPYNKNDLVKAIENCWQKPFLRKKLSSLGIKQAAKFSWEKTARKTLNVYKGVYEKRI